jgi:arylsulfatase A-like enzyme
MNVVINIVIRVLCLSVVASLAACRGYTPLPLPAPDSIGKQSRTNFVVILLDDMGTHDLGVSGNTFIETPAMDQLAREGVVLSQAYANAPNCAPSRAALMSGQYPTRTGVYTMMTGDIGNASRRKLLAAPNRAHLPERVYTLAEALRDSGYVTAHIGKWNLGTGPVRGPRGQGFDINIGGYRGGAKHYMAPYAQELPGLQSAPKGEYLTDRLNGEAVKFIEQHSDKPFFLYLSHFAPHFPIQAPAETNAKYERKRDEICAREPGHDYCDPRSHYPEYAAMLEHVDRGLNDVRAALKREGLDGNTVIVVTSDNGGYAWSNELQVSRGMKSQLYEGGIRVPMIWHVPRSRVAGRSNDTPVTLMDIYPTVLNMAGASPVGLQLDGSDLSPIVFKPDTSGAASLRKRPLFWYLPGYTVDSEVTDEALATPQVDRPFTQLPASVLRQGGWKLIRYYGDTPSELYDLSMDPKEQRDLFDATPVHARSMMKTLESWLRETGGVLDLPPNPAYGQGQ